MHGILLILNSGYIKLKDKMWKNKDHILWVYLILSTFVKKTMTVKVSVQCCYVYFRVCVRPFGAVDTKYEYNNFMT